MTDKPPRVIRLGEIVFEPGQQVYVSKSIAMTLDPTETLAVEFSIRHLSKPKRTRPRQPWEKR